MTEDTDARISRLMDRLERPDLSEKERRDAERQLDRLLADKVMQT